MSDYEYKMVLRVCNENVSSKEEHLAWMRKITGEEPQWVEGEDPDDDMEFNFSYTRHNENGTRRQHTTKDKPYLLDVSSGDLYGADYVIAWTVGEPPMVCMDHRELESHQRDFENFTGSEPWQVNILFYGWWNGGDESIQWS